jgi:glycosyltransferase involved in cell wall biosynthesis
MTEILLIRHGETDWNRVRRLQGHIDIDLNDCLIVLHAPTDRNFKGTNFIIDAVHELIDDGYNIELRLIENLNHSQLMSEYKQCHVFVDQILAGWYGTAAIEAMAFSKPVVAFLRENYLDCVEYGFNIPIINANPDNFKEVFLREVILKKRDLKNIGVNSRLFVEKVHCSKKVTQQLIDLYNQMYF